MDDNTSKTAYTLPRGKKFPKLTKFTDLQFFNQKYHLEVTVMFMYMYLEVPCRVRMGSVTAWNMTNKLTFLATVPMFHCNGWGYPWTAALVHAKVVCCRYIVAKDIYNLVVNVRVS